MDFKFKNMAQYIRNAVEPISRALQIWMKTNCMSITGGSFLGPVNGIWLDLGEDSIMDLSKANFFYKDCATGFLDFSFINIPETKAMTVSLCLDNCAGRALSWPSSVIWNGGSAPTFSSNSIVTFFIMGDSRIYAWRSFSKA